MHNVTLFRVDDRTVADSVLESLRAEGLDGSITDAETGTGEAFVLFWRPSVPTSGTAGSHRL